MRLCIRIAGMAILAILSTHGLVALAETIPAAEIANLQRELATVTRSLSAVEARLACKSVVRKATSLLAGMPEAPNRHAVLSLVLNAQKRLLALDNSPRNREAVYATCEMLLETPDAYATLRLDADLLLNERDLSARNATIAERVSALRALLSRYRGTNAEWRSLQIGAMIATKLLAFDFEEEIRATIAERFSGDHRAIAIRRSQDRVNVVDAVFSGSYTNVSGDVLVFPFDRLGHHSLVLFWSTDSGDHVRFLREVKLQQERFPGRFEVYSFNTDALPDAGKSILQDAGLDAMAMHLPGGAQHSAAMAYGGGRPTARLVNGLGRIFLQRDQSLPWPQVDASDPRAKPSPGLGLWLDDDRYLAQLRYLFSGAFLVAESGGVAGSSDSGLPAARQETIQVCFKPPPEAYRQNAKETFAQLKEAERLCAEGLADVGEKSGIWWARNRRIVALLGMWSLRGNSSYLTKASSEARKALDTVLPPGGDVVPRFCLALSALRDQGGDPEVVLPAFVEACGNSDASLSAATVLAMVANSRTMYKRYRHLLLSGIEGQGNPALWSVIAFLRDQLHQYRLFWASPGHDGYPRYEKYNFRNTVGGFTTPSVQSVSLKTRLRDLVGKSLPISGETSPDMVGLIVAEPPATESARSIWLEHLHTFASTFQEGDVDVVVAVLSADTNAVAALEADTNLAGRVVAVPDGLRNPMVRRLGILNADAIPNPFLVRADGSVAWSVSGLQYHAFGQILHHAIRRAIENNIAKVRTDPGFAALQRGDFKQALERFADDKRYESLPYAAWAAARLHGRALAYAGLEDWASALLAIDAAIARRREDFQSALCKCHGLVEMYLTRAMILDRLDRASDAAAARRLADAEDLPHPNLPSFFARSGIPVGVYYDLLADVRRMFVR